MREQDFDEFAGIFDAVIGLYPTARSPTAAQRMLWFRTLCGYALESVRAAFEAHVKDAERGRFAPMPADVIAQLEGAIADDGRPGAEEAWAIAVAGADEEATIVWTNEMAEAWGIARAVLHAGDQVGARMAFREAYERLVELARRARRPCVWSASLGYDGAAREVAIEEAVQRGRLARADYPRLPPIAPELLPAPDRAVAQPLVPPNAREGLARLRTRFAGVPPESALQWAFDLRDRELRGEELTATQSTIWRAAVGAAPRPTLPGSGFTPPPEDTLPPGMRSKAAGDAVARRAA